MAISQVNNNDIDLWIRVQALEQVNALKDLQPIDLTNPYDPKTRKYLHESALAREMVEDACRYFEIQGQIAYQQKIQEKEAMLNEMQYMAERAADAFMKDLERQAGFNRRSDQKRLQDLLAKEESKLLRSLEKLASEKQWLAAEHKLLTAKADAVVNDVAKEWEERHDRALDNLFDKGIAGDKSYVETAREFRDKLVHDPVFKAEVATFEDQLRQYKNQLKEIHKALLKASKKVERLTVQLHWVETQKLLATGKRREELKGKKAEIKKRIEDKKEEVRRLADDEKELKREIKRLKNENERLDKSKNMVVDDRGQEVAPDVVRQTMKKAQVNPRVIAQTDVNQMVMNVIDSSVNPQGPVHEDADNIPLPPPPPADVNRVKQDVCKTLAAKNNAFAQINLLGQLCGVEAGANINPFQVFEQGNTWGMLSHLYAKAKQQTHASDLEEMEKIVDVKYDVHHNEQRMSQVDAEMAEKEAKLEALRQRRRELEASPAPTPSASNMWSPGAKNE